MARLSEILSTKTSKYQTRTIYIGVADTDVWIDAVRFCNANGVGLSKLVADALRYYLARLTTKE